MRHEHCRTRRRRSWPFSRSCAPAPPAAQIPERFTNLEVLPKDVPRKDLVLDDAGVGERPRRAVRPLPHRRQPGYPRGRRLRSDAKWEKRTARSMFRMVQAVEADYLGKLESPADRGGPEARCPPLTSPA